MSDKQIIVLNGGAVSEKELSTFSKSYETDGLKSETGPSPIAIGGVPGITLIKLKPENIEPFLLMNPIVPRGIELKSNRMIERGFKIKGLHEEAVQYCKNILVNSGGKTWVKKLIENSYGFGYGVSTLVPNVEGSEVVRCNLEHPIYFRIARYGKDYSDPVLRGKLKIDKNTKQPLGYSEYRFDQQGKIIPYGSELEPDKVIYLAFDTWGDESEGYSVVQYLHRDIKYLMNIDEGGAETMYRNGFNQKKVTTNAKTDKQMKAIANNVKNINLRDVIVLPDGSDVMNLEPGKTDFKQYHDVFVSNIATKLGVPLPLLTQDASSTNKSVLKEQRKDMRADFGADEDIVKDVIENQLFLPACRLKFGENFVFEDVPEFIFNEIIEDKESRSNNLLTESKYVLNLTESAERLKEIGYTEMADTVIEVLKLNFSKDSKFKTEDAEKNYYVEFIT